MTEISSASTGARRVPCEVRQRPWSSVSHGSERFVRRPEAEALARRTVHTAFDLFQVRGRDAREVQLAGQIAAQPPIGVFDAAFLPGAVRVAEVGGDPVSPRQMLVAEELGATVEGDGPTCRRRQADEGIADGPDDVARAPVTVRDEANQAASALHQGGHIGLAVDALEDQQVGLPMPDLLPLVNPGGPLRDRALERDFGTAGPAAEATATQVPGPEQVAIEPERAAFRAVDELVDRLVAQARVIVGELEPAGDLFGRPPARQHLGHVLPQLGILDQLPPPLPALPGAIIGRARIVPAVLLHLAEQVASDLTVDGGAMAAELLCDPVDRDLGAEQAEDGATFLEGQLAVGAGHVVDAKA